MILYELIFPPGSCTVLYKRVVGLRLGRTVQYSTLMPKGGGGSTNIGAFSMGAFEFAGIASGTDLN